MSKDEYLITDAPLKALTVFAMPMILGSFFQQVYNMADSIIVGQFVGSSAPGGRKQRSAGASRKRAPQLLYEMRKIL